MNHQGVQFNGVLARVGTRQDGSLGLSIETPELTPEEKLAVFSLQNVPCEITFRPNDEAAPPKEIKGELNRKTISTRIRGVIFVWWKSCGEPGEFAAFYESEGNKIINSYKAKLPPIP